MRLLRSMASGLALLIAWLSICATGAANPQASLDPGAASTRDPPGQDPPALLSRGKQQFEAICSACHGANARGGRNGAPDLLISEVVQAGGTRLRDFVRAGSPARGMPPVALDEDSLGAIRMYLATLSEAARRRGNREIPLVGNPQRGRAYFEGAGGCAGCHSVSGDLAGIGSRYPPRVLQGRIVLPRGSGVHPGLIALGVRIPGVTDGPAVRDSPRTVTVITPAGERIDGALIGMSDFDVALRDSRGTYRSFSRQDGVPRVELHDPAQPHLDRLGHWSDTDLHDVTTYLATIK